MCLTWVAWPGGGGTQRLGAWGAVGERLRGLDRGSWSLVVPAGTYTVEGRSPNLVWNGAEVPCRPASSQQPAVVSADQTTTVDVYCALR